jgi:hypothetical protein
MADLQAIVWEDLPVRVQGDLDDYIRVIAQEVVDANGGGDGLTEVRQVLSPTLTQWTIASVPLLPHLSKFFIQGQKQVFGIDYNVNGTLVSWFGSFALKPSFIVEFYYYI